MAYSIGTGRVEDWYVSGTGRVEDWYRHGEGRGLVRETVPLLAGGCVIDSHVGLRNQ